MHNTMDFGIIILAAGSSSRLGQPKQLLDFKGKTLLQHAVESALASAPTNVITVLGSNDERVKPTLTGYDTTVVTNSEWQEGMASSIRCGLTKLMEKNPAVEAAIIMVCDQPFTDSNLLKELVAKYDRSNKPVVASVYDDAPGTPALFDKSVFPKLLQLTGDRGAKKIILQNPELAELVPFDLGSKDIDTMADYKSL